MFEIYLYKQKQSDYCEQLRLRWISDKYAIQIRISKNVHNGLSCVCGKSDVSIRRTVEWSDRWAVGQHKSDPYRNLLPYEIAIVLEKSECHEGDFYLRWSLKCRSWFHAISKTIKQFTKCWKWCRPKRSRFAVAIIEFVISQSNAFGLNDILRRLFEFTFHSNVVSLWRVKLTLQRLH